MPSLSSDDTEKEADAEGEQDESFSLSRFSSNLVKQVCHNGDQIRVHSYHCCCVSVAAVVVFVVVVVVVVAGYVFYNG